MRLHASGRLDDLQDMLDFVYFHPTCCQASITIKAFLARYVSLILKHIPELNVQLCNTQPNVY